MEDLYKYQLRHLKNEFNEIKGAFGDQRGRNFVLDNCEFNLNVDYHRGDNFSSKTELLYSGCSMTLGMGLPQDDIWGEILSEKLGLSKANLSYAGGSIPHIVNQIFNYIEKFGDPKILLCAFPSTDRIYWWSDNKIIKSLNPNYPNGFFLDFQNLPRESYEIDKYIKLPSSADQILHAQSASYYSIFSIRMLENYCNSKGIFFRWTFWARNETFDVADFKNKISFLSDDCDLKFKNGEHFFVDYNGNKINCHKDYENQPTFSAALDYSKDSIPHQGKHVHLHISEAFEKEIREKINNDNIGN